ncbi:MAG: hypothetical protein RLZZ480_757 [Candidatus Parcubacteria bacterium]|jgi:hypothetical protein
MVKIFRQLATSCLVTLFLAAPLFVGAAAGDSNPGPNPGGGGITNQYKLVNPIKVDSIQDLLELILRLVIIIATPLVVLFIILAGFKYVTARGDARQVEDATKALTYAVIGGILIIGATAIATIIKNFVNSF